MAQITRTSVVDQVTDIIKEYILDDSVNVGDKLPTERWFCETYSVSRSTVREAFRALQTEGFLENKQGKGAFVVSKKGKMWDAASWLSEHNASIKNLLEVRRAIEVLAVQLAVEYATDEQINELEKLYSVYLETLPENDAEKMSELDALFHHCIAKMSNNPLLIKFSELLTMNLHDFREKTFEIPENMKNSVEPHKEILEAIKSRDVKKGEQAMRDHMNKVFEDLDKTK